MKVITRRPCHFCTKKKKCKIKIIEKAKNINFPYIHALAVKCVEVHLFIYFFMTSPPPLQMARQTDRQSD